MGHEVGSPEKRRSQRTSLREHRRGGAHPRRPLAREKIGKVLGPRGPVATLIFSLARGRRVSVHRNSRGPSSPGPGVQWEWWGSNGISMDFSETPPKTPCAKLHPAKRRTILRGAALHISANFVAQNAENICSQTGCVSRPTRPSGTRKDRICVGTAFPAEFLDGMCHGLSRAFSHASFCAVFPDKLHSPGGRPDLFSKHLAERFSRRR